MSTVSDTESTLTVTETATVPEEETSAPGSGSSGSELNDAGFARMQAEDYAGALPLLEQAVSQLAGTGSLAEAYASYNLAFTRLALGSCDDVLELLDRSEEVQGGRSEIERLRREAEKQCGDGPGKAREQERRRRLAQQREHFAVFGEAALGLLREDEPSVRQHVELRPRTRRRGGGDVEHLRDLGRETRGSHVVPASGGAVQDLDGHAGRTLANEVSVTAQIVLNCSNGWRQLSQ